MPAPSRIQVDELTVNNIGQLKTIAKCSDYDQEIVFTKDSKLIYYNDLCVGGIVYNAHGDFMEIKFIGILPNYRNLGLGKQLVLELIDHVKNLTGLDKLQGVVVESSSEFFSKCGFEKDGGRMVYKI